MCSVGCELNYNLQSELCNLKSNVAGLNWSWILFALVVPAILGGAVAYPLWRTGQPIFGNIAGSAVSCPAAVGLIMRGHVVLDRIVQDCLDDAVTCWSEASA